MSASNDSASSIKDRLIESLPVGASKAVETSLASVTNYRARQGPTISTKMQFICRIVAGHFIRVITRHFAPYAR